MTAPCTRSIVVGANGYIGRRLFERAKTTTISVGTSSAGSPDFLSLRLDQPRHFDYRKISPGDTIFLTAAISSPDICRREADRAWSTNVSGTSYFISESISQGARIIFFSSDTVYGEQEKPFDETTTTSPAGEYARMKAAVENEFEGCAQFKSVRLSYVFSRHDKFTQYLSQCASQNEEAEIFHPFRRAIIYREDVVEAALMLARKWSDFPQRFINFGGPEILSRIDFAEKLKQFALPDLKYNIKTPGEDFFVGRPKSIAMTSPHIGKLLTSHPKTLKAACHLEFADK